MHSIKVRNIIVVSFCSGRKLLRFSLNPCARVVGAEHAVGEVRTRVVGTEHAVGEVRTRVVGTEHAVGEVRARLGGGDRTCCWGGTCKVGGWGQNMLLGRYVPSGKLVTL